MQIQSEDTKIVPQLFLKKGRKLFQIQPEQCDEAMERFKNGRGASEMRKQHIDLYSIDGAKIGFVSFNGRVWLGDFNNRVEIKVGDIPTAREMDARDWK